MADVVLKCPSCQYEFDSPFQEVEKTKGIHTNCPKCANSFEIYSNLKYNSMRRDHFENWLLSGDHGIHGRSISDYLSRLGRMEEQLDLDIDSFTPEEIRNNILNWTNPRNFPERSEHYVRNLRAVIHKYIEFLEDNIQ